MNNYPKSFALLGGPIGTAQFVMAVGFARIYFHNHWMGDIVAGLFCGTFIGAFLVRVKFK